MGKRIMRRSQNLAICTPSWEPQAAHEGPRTRQIIVAVLRIQPTCGSTDPLRGDLCRTDAAVAGLAACSWSFLCRHLCSQDVSI